MLIWTIAATVAIVVGAWFIVPADDHELPRSYHAISLKVRGLH